jgi:hypothetical protein
MAAMIVLHAKAYFVCLVMYGGIRREAHLYYLAVVKLLSGEEFKI